LWGAAAPAEVSRTFGTAEQKRHSSGGAELEPLSRRLLQAAGVLSLLLILVVVNSLFNGGSESPFDPNPVAAAAERTQAVPGMRISMEMRIETESAPPFSINGKGAYNGDSGLTAFTYEAHPPEGGPMDFDALLSDDAWYFRYPHLAAQMPDGKEWVKVEGMLGQTEESAMSAESPENTLKILGAAGAITKVGKATVRKVPTTRYRATLNPAGIVESLRAQGQDELAEQFEGIAPQLVGPVESEVFIDREGMLRRIHTRSTVLADGAPATTDLWMDLFAFGVEPDVVVPDDSVVFDLSPMLEEQLGTFGEAS
jgi:hypothetical protein